MEGGTGQNANVGNRIFSEMENTQMEATSAAVHTDLLSKRRGRNHKEISHFPPRNPGNFQRVVTDRNRDFRRSHNHYDRGTRIIHSGISESESTDDFTSSVPSSDGDTDTNDDFTESINLTTIGPESSGTTTTNSDGDTATRGFVFTIATLM